MVARPHRVQLPDFSGTLVTLSGNPQNWISLSADSTSQKILLCGLGPDSSFDLPFLKKAKRIYWLEAPQTLDAMRKRDLHKSFPDNWQQVTLEQAKNLYPSCSTWLYRPGTRLAPDFWGPFMGYCDGLPIAQLMCPPPTPQPHLAEKQASVILPGNDTQLLHPCLCTTLRNMGFTRIVTALPPIPVNQNLGEAWDKILDGHLPTLVLAVNGRGFDSEGRLFHFFEELHIPVAIWFVDNPWHVLSGWRLPWWKKAALFVTDSSFISPLKNAGAQRVWHLPLAVAPHMWANENTVSTNQQGQGPPLFVGRSQFPGRSHFFAAARVSPELLDLAMEQLTLHGETDQLPHFHWWADKLQARPWPTHDIRNAGFGAEQCALANRTRWLAEGLKVGMQIVGDEGWQSIFPNAAIMPPVDYYTALPHLYEHARCVLNVTSLLLPHSLSQRHFDVWAANGFLVSDATPGLELFPKELTAPIIVHHPAQLPDILKKTCASHKSYNELKAAWREHLRNAHTYEHRINNILEHVL